MRRIALALCVVAIVGGCGDAERGGGSVDTDPTPNWKRPNGLVYVTPGVTKERFVTHLNEYCRREWPGILADPSSYFASLTFYVYSGIQSYGTAPGERGTVEHLLFAMKDGVTQGERLEITDPARVEAAFADYNRTARRLGLDECLVAGAHLPGPRA